MLWAGDQLSTFDELRSQLNAGLSASASGVIFWGFDIGGFAGELPTPELYMRATQLACFSPVMQWHSEPDGGQFKLLQPGMEGNNERSPWNIERAFGLPGYAEKVRYWHLLRMELLPYIREQARLCVERRMPLMRPMAYAFPADARCAGIDDEYMFGDTLLAAPVTAPGVTSREVYLPAGEWFDFYTGERFEGGRAVNIECEERIPVFSLGARRRGMRLEGIIFDLDGVLCRTDRYHLAAWRTLAGRLGIALPPDAAERTRGVGRMESLDIVLGERAGDFTREQKRALAEEKKRPLPRISRAAHARRRGAVRAGDPGGAAPPGRKARRRLVEPQRAAYSGQAGPFGAARRHNRRRHDSRSKPDPEVFLKAAAALALPSARCAVVEDAQSGIEAARRGGFLAIAYTPAPRRLAGADKEIHTLPELLEL